MDKTTQALLEASYNILNSRNYVQSIRKILFTAQQLLQSEAASIFLLDSKKRRLQMVAATNIPPRKCKNISFSVGVGVAGWVAKHGKTVKLEDITRDKRFYLGVEKQVGFTTKGYICVPLKYNDTVLGTVQLLNRTKGEAFSDSDQELLEGFAVIAALAIRQQKMHEVALEKQKIDSDLKVAKEFQERLLPTSFDPPKTLKLWAYNKPARDLGGDLYDAFQHQDGYTIVVGDVSGKGPGAAIWMSGLSNILRYVTSQNLDPLTQLQSIDRHLTNTLPPEAFITVFIGTFKDDTLHYASYGHNPMPVFQDGEEIQWLESTGLPMSLMPDMPAEVKSIPFTKGMKLALYSDGITEAENRKEDMFGEDRLERILDNHSSESAEAIGKRVIRSVERFTRGTVQSDDITLVVIEHV